MSKIKCKICRRLGVSVCFSEKCALARKPYPPGNKSKRGKRMLSEYGKELREKQILKYWYNLTESQLAGYVKSCLGKRKGEDAGELLIRELESRLDNVVFRMGVASSRSQARQIVNHGHFLVNGKRVNIPSFKAKKGDIVALVPGSAKKAYFQEILPELKKHKTPSWINFEPEKFQAEITGQPTLEEANPPVEMSAIFEFYSR